MLEGNELDGKIGDMGAYALDVDAQGVVKVSANIDKDFGPAKVGLVSTIETNIFKLAELITKKTETQWDDKALEGLKGLLGIK